VRFTNIETLLYTFHYLNFREICIYSKEWQLGMQEGLFPHTHSFESNESQPSCLFPSLFTKKTDAKNEP
jgi:hypothetical protein